MNMQNFDYYLTRNLTTRFSQKKLISSLPIMFFLLHNLSTSDQYYINELGQVNNQR